MHGFSYHKPASTADAAALLAANPEAKLLAGGMSLLPVMKQRLAQPSDLVDLTALAELKAIDTSGGGVTVGAMVTHDRVARSPEVRAAIPALAALAGGIGDPQVRNRGTLGGSIANADPAADYPAALLGLAAQVRTDRRSIAADDFFTGLYETALEPGEIVLAVYFAVPDAAAYMKMPHPASRFAVVGVFIARSGAAVRVGVTGAAAFAFRATAIEQALGERFEPGALDGIRIPATEMSSDIHADADYRAHLVRVMAQRAVAAILAGSAQA